MSRLRTLLLGPDADRRRCRSGLEEALPAEIVGEAARSRAGAELAQLHQPELIVVCVAGDLDEALRLSESLHLSCPLAALLWVGARLDVTELAYAMQVGVREVVPEAEGLLEAALRAKTFLERLHGARTPPPEVRHGPARTLVVHAPKGGCGKSTLAANLAVALADEPGGCVLVDLSTQFAEIDLLFNVKPHAYLSDLARHGRKVDMEALEQALCRHESGVLLLASAPGPEEGELIDKATVEAVLGLLRRRAAFVVVDTSAALSEPIVAAMELADRLIVPVSPDLASLRRLQQAVKLWGELGVDPGKCQWVGWSAKSDVEGEAIARILHRPLAATLPWVPEAALGAINAGSPLVVSAPKGPYAKAVRAYAETFRERPSTALVPVTGGWASWRALWSRWRRKNDVSAQPT